MTILRVYKPEECDSAGNPLGWLECRKCDGLGKRLLDFATGTGLTLCPACDGHRSLHAAALALLLGGEKCARCYGTGELESSDSTEDGWWDCGSCEGTGRKGAREARCEDCQHPWEGHPDDYHDSLKWAEDELRAGREPEDPDGPDYSACDDLCNHGGPVRLLRDHAPPIYLPDQGPITPDWMVVHAPVEASWRPVDVRRLSWPMDLRPESLACLCLRCWANRTKEAP